MWLRPKVLVTRSRRFLKPQLFSRIRVDGAKSQGWFCAREGGGGGVLSTMACTGRLRSTRVSFSGFRYMTG